MRHITTVKDLDYTKDDYLALAKNYEIYLTIPGQIIALFGQLFSKNSKKQHQHIYMCIMLSMK